MSLNPKTRNLLVAVGSRHDRVCSIGSFARAEAKAMRDVFGEVTVLEPNKQDLYPVVSNVLEPDYILFHAPALHDRKKPWNALLSAAKIRIAFPRAKFLVVVHEFSEAPKHWKLRQIALTKLAHGVITNSAPDFEAVSRWHRNVLRSSLGPTLFFDELLKDEAASEKSARIAKMRKEARRVLLDKYPDKLTINDSKWILHPGLITPGKGINFFGQLSPCIDSNSKLILMGGFGPKERDREFAKASLGKLSNDLGERLVFLDSPDDETFRQMLLASDLVVLPYDNGLSERRSSFLAAMSCGANVWTTVGSYTKPMSLEVTGVHQTSVEQWMRGGASVIEALKQALSESEQVGIERRMKNLLWASKRTWQFRAESVRNFLSSLR